MWTDDRGVTYNERELRLLLFGMGMHYPHVAMEFRDEIEYGGCFFYKVKEN